MNFKLILYKKCKENKNKRISITGEQRYKSIIRKMLLFEKTFISLLYNYFSIVISHFTPTKHISPIVKISSSPLSVVFGHAYFSSRYVVYI